MPRVAAIALNTFREAVRDRVLYNLIVFALLLIGTAILFGQISIGVERLIVINLGLTAVTFFGLAIAIFIGIGLVYKEMDQRTLHVLLAKPGRRVEVPWVKAVGEGVYYVIPNFRNFNIISSVAQGHPVPPALLWQNTAYAALYIGLVLAASALIFQNRNLK